MLDVSALAYQKARKRLLLLDYDGTLVDFALLPSQASPTPRLLRALERLTANPRTTIAIISGRPKQTLEDWLGNLPIALIAEHGFFAKLPRQPWQTLRPINNQWKSSVRTAMELSVVVLAGSFIEEKDSSLVWHYRTADENSAANETPHLLSRLEPLVARHELVMLQGHKNIEIKLDHATKGSAALSWLDKDDWDFILAAGDDVTDEDLFAVMPASAFTVKIGTGASKASHHLPNPDALLNLLESFCKT
ncbi:MAG TPA: trehalose-phosphatase [Candidatus Saccharimonadales bacterium]